MKIRLLVLSLLFMLWESGVRAQEGIPIYYDYLTDNLTLIHPAMVGASRCSKVRLNGRMQWSGVKDFPMLQTLSVNSHLGRNSGFGVIIYNDRNGYHTQKGLQFAYAHHLQLSQGATLNQLSFGLAAMYSLNQINTEDFADYAPDPVLQNVMKSGGYFNVDVGMAWHVENFFFIASAKNLLLMHRPLYSPGIENANLRNYVVNTGYFIGKRQGLHAEPSVMLQYKEYSGDFIGDFNLKFYYDLQGGGAFFGGVSYRNYFTTTATQSLQDITPLIGVFLNRFVIAYVYTYQLSETTFSKGGFHQITLGFNFDCRIREPHYGCPHLR
ncbi:MAG: type IX secretion system membrane protein PorP/SprF [Chlorobi bacterium]|nr:type IX secretion system membrane protein PorP/SprF [Chlorobiota bacterium]